MSSDGSNGLQARVFALNGNTPSFADDVFVAPGSVVCGNVHADEGTSIWYGTVVRGDVGEVRIGKRVNIQDQSLVHMTGGLSSVSIGDDVTIGHRAIIHGCTIEDRVLIGMGAIVMDNAVIGEESVIGAGALIPPGKVIPPRSMVMGAPGRVVRQVADHEVARTVLSSAHYVENAAEHMAALAEDI